MEDEQTSVKMMLSAIIEYYSGKQIKHICDDYDIEESTFEVWLADYKQVAFEMMELKLENEKLREMYINLSLRLRDH